MKPQMNVLNKPHVSNETAKKILRQVLARPGSRCGVRRGLQLPLGCLKWMLTAATCLGHLRWPCKQYWVNGKSGAQSKPFGKQQRALKLLDWLHLGFFLQLKGAKGFPTHLMHTYCQMFV